VTADNSGGKRPHILALVTDAFGGHGGIALYMRDTLRCVATMEPSPTITLIARSGRTEGVDVPANIDWIRHALTGKWQFTRAVLSAMTKGRKPDLVLCGHINLLPLARLVAITTGARLMLFIYGIDVWMPPKGLLARKMANSADLTISISEITQQRFSVWSGIDQQRVKLVPNAIKLDRYGEGPKCPELLARYGLEGKSVLMTLGRLSSVQRHKGVDEVIEVMPRLLLEVPDLVYLIAGGGDDIPRLQQKAEDLGIAERVVFTGLVEESEKADHYRLADAFALTGRGDGFGFVLLEAMACGVPVVASVLDGSQEAVLKGELGVLVNPNEPDSLVSGLLHALRQPRGIPAGLEYFAYERFCERLRAAIAPSMEKAA